ncbi:MAG: YtxH domain-containing protein [bacterium]
MSYAGPPKSRAEGASTNAAAGSRSSTARRQKGAFVATSAGGADWQQLAVFGAGLAVGIALGAGIALLTAPQAGAETRADLRYGASRTTRAIGRRSRNAWLDLRDELRGATQSISRRKARRAADRARREELARESAT